MGKQRRDRVRRRKYVVDRRLQVGVTLQLVAVLGGMGLLYTIALAFVPEDSMGTLDAEGTRAFLTTTTAVYFALTIAILATTTFIVTHRIAGPACVFRRAVEAMLRNDFSTRLELRSHDHLQELAASLRRLGSHLQTREESVQDLLRCVEEGDLDAARELAARLAAAPDRREVPAQAP